MDHHQSDFVVSLTVDAPRQRVWDAWTRADALAKWWGPKGADLRVIALDMRPGGIFHYAMAFQPGHDMYGRFIYREVESPSRLVFVNSFSDTAGGITRAPFPQLGDTWPLEVLNRLTLTEQGGKTTLDLRGSPITANDAELQTFTGMHASMQQGFAGTFDKLREYLAGG